MKSQESNKYKLGSLKPAAGSKGTIKKVGRGHSSGVGKTCGRGHKGQKSRSGGVKRPGFEGGQTPLYRRLPKINRFSNFDFKTTYKPVNISALTKFKNDISIKTFIDSGFINEGELVKVLGDGELKHALNIEAHAFSKSAKKKIEAAGGKATTAKA